jgi:hypothetical protein
MFLAVMVAGLVGVIRRWRTTGRIAALPWALAAASIVLPAMLTQSLYRYTIVAIPLACIAAGMAFLRPRREAALAAAAAAADGPDGPDGPRPGTTRPLGGQGGDIPEDGGSTQPVRADQVNGARDRGSTQPLGEDSGTPSPGSTQPLGERGGTPDPGATHPLSRRDTAEP